MHTHTHTPNAFSIHLKAGLMTMATGLLSASDSVGVVNGLRHTRTHADVRRHTHTHIEHNNLQITLAFDFILPFDLRAHLGRSRCCDCDQRLSSGGNWHIGICAAKELIPVIGWHRKVRWRTAAAAAASASRNAAICCIVCDAAAATIVIYTRTPMPDV